MLQEAKQNEELTRVSQKMVSWCLESEGNRGNIMYSVMDLRREMKWNLLGSVVCGTRLCHASRVCVIMR